MNTGQKLSRLALPQTLGLSEPGFSMDICQINYKSVRKCQLTMSGRNKPGVRGKEAPFEIPPSGAVELQGHTRTELFHSSFSNSEKSHGVLETVYPRKRTKHLLQIITVVIANKLKNNGVWLGHISNKLENFLQTFQSLYRTKQTLD